MRIDCPLCGLRPNAEFTVLGDAKNQRPDADAPPGAAWHDYVYLRDNNKGWISEYWQHTGGCRAWLKVERNNVSHDVASVILARLSAKPTPNKKTPRKRAAKKPARSTK